MKNVAIVLLFILLVSGTNVYADSVDFGMFTDYYSFSLDVRPGFNPYSVVAEVASTFGKTKVDSSGDMTDVGDYETWEHGRKHNVLALGYRMESGITPWVGWSRQEIDTKKTTVVEKSEDGKVVKKTNSLNEPIKGLALGLNLDYWSGDLGLAATLAKLPKSILTSAKLKYKITDLVSTHVGFTYNFYLDTAKLTAGVGIHY